jgi:signal peptidase II
MLPTLPSQTGRGGDGVSGRGRLLRVLSLVFLVVGLFGCDHVTKIAAKTTLEGNPAVPVAPGVLRGAVELRYVENEDIAFSALSSLGIPHSARLLSAVSALAFLAMVAAAFVVRHRRTAFEPSVPQGLPGDLGRDRVAQVGFALALGGGLGNLVDRVVRGCVIDFVHVKGWPVFNVADIAIVLGMGVVALRWRRCPPEGKRTVLE